MLAIPQLYGPLMLAVLLTAAAAIWDLRTGLIPNRLVLGGAICAIALVLGVALAEGGQQLSRASLSLLLGGVLASLVPLLLYRLNGIGGGDVKLLAVVGAALGPIMGMEAELYAFMALLLYAPAQLLWQGKLLRTLRNSGLLLVRPLLPRHKRPVPVPAEALTAFRFGPAIFLGTFTTALLRVIEVAYR